MARSTKNYKSCSAADFQLKFGASPAAEHLQDAQNNFAHAAAAAAAFIDFRTS
jgi:hypothetical protein